MSTLVASPQVVSDPTPSIKDITMTVANGFSIEPATEDDIPRIAEILIPSFADIPFEALLGNVDNPEGHKSCGARHLRAWRDHHAETGTWPAVKCVHRDPASGKETLVGCAEWFIFPEPRTAERERKVNYLFEASWVPEAGGQRAKAKRWLQPVVDNRAKWSVGRAHAVFMYLATDRAWRRKGAGTMCVEWGLQKCRELGIPAMLESSEDGLNVYSSLGFEHADDVTMDFDETKVSFPFMIYWPPGTREVDKKPSCA